MISTESNTNDDVMQITLGELRRLIREAAYRTRPRRRDYEQGRITPGQKFYHASPRRFRHGDILTGGHSGGEGTAHSSVCMTTSPDPHGTIRASIPDWSQHRRRDDREFDDPSRPGYDPKQVDADWYVYEVEPLYDVSYVEGNNEYQTQAARVVRNLGKASAILKKRAPVGGVAAALSPARDRDRSEKHAKRRARKMRKLDADEE